jgi:hypothetical protein
LRGRRRKFILITKYRSYPSWTRGEGAGEVATKMGSGQAEKMYSTMMDKKREGDEAPAIGSSR